VTGDASIAGVAANFAAAAKQLGRAKRVLPIPFASTHWHSSVGNRLNDAVRQADIGKSLLTGLGNEAQAQEGAALVQRIHDFQTTFSTSDPGLTWWRAQHGSALVKDIKSFASRLDVTAEGVKYRLADVLDKRTEELATDDLAELDMLLHNVPKEARFEIPAPGHRRWPLSRTLPKIIDEGQGVRLEYWGVKRDIAQLRLKVFAGAPEVMMDRVEELLERPTAAFVEEDMRELAVYVEALGNSLTDRLPWMKDDLKRFTQSVSGAGKMRASFIHSQYAKTIVKMRLGLDVKSQAEAVERLKNISLESFVFGDAMMEAQALTQFLPQEMRVPAEEIPEMWQPLLQAGNSDWKWPVTAYVNALSTEADKLAADGDTDVLREMAADVNELKDRTLNRLSSNYPSSDTREVGLGNSGGYSDYPEYGEVGKLTSTVQMMRVLAQGESAEAEAAAAANPDIVKF
jgi:hypothetical protein